MRLPLASVLLVVALAGCQATGVRLDDLQPGQRPALDTDEAGLWMVADKAERVVRESGRVVEDKAVNDYVSSVVCRLAPAHCDQIRIAVIRTPHFNATMSPNGHMHVWTGLMLRAENEDQLAYVLGHEVGHYLRRHSVARWRAIRATTDATSFFQVLTAAAGVPIVGTVGSYAALGGLLAYSRDHEREADESGLEMMAAAGYDPSQAPLIWEALMAEREAEKKPQQSIFFSTHPSTQERVDSLRARAAALAGTGAARPASRHRGVVAGHAREWMKDELRKREFAATLVLLDRLDRAYGFPGSIAFFRGEVYRLRGDDGDGERAIQAYRGAISAGDTPVAVHRSLGLMLWRAGRGAEARDAFQTYLVRAPNADDRQMVASYLARIEE